MFVRVRGQQVAASVTNPGSASMEYRQAQGAASRTNKRKCPLMPPASASSLSPDQLTDTLLGVLGRYQYEICKIANRISALFPRDMC